MHLSPTEPYSDRSRVGARVCPRSGEQLVESALRMVLHSRDDVGELGKRIDAAGLAGRDEGVQPAMLAPASTSPTKR